MSELQKLYDGLPKLQCKGLCQQSRGPIPLMPIERQEILAAGHSLPGTQDHMKYGNITCSALNMKGRCSIYEHRPMICRLWGVVPEMPCPHGCQPDRRLRVGEGHKLLDLVMSLKPGQILITGVSEVISTMLTKK